jgi:hypothetical protein
MISGIGLGLEPYPIKCDHPPIVIPVSGLDPGIDPGISGRCPRIKSGHNETKEQFNLN